MATPRSLTSRSPSVDFPPDLPWPRKSNATTPTDLFSLLATFHTAPCCHDRVKPCASTTAKSPSLARWTASIGTPSSVTSVLAFSTGFVISLLCSTGRVTRPGSRGCRAHVRVFTERRCEPWRRWHAGRRADSRFHLPRRAGPARRGPRGHRARGRRCGVRLPCGDGSLLPDPGDRAARAGDARGVHHAGVPGRMHLAVEAAHAGDRDGLPAPGHPGQDRDHTGRAVRRTGLARHRRGLERRGVPRTRHPVPAGGRAVRAPRGNAADLPADVARRRIALHRPALPA